MRSYSRARSQRGADVAGAVRLHDERERGREHRLERLEVEAAGGERAALAAVEGGAVLGVEAGVVQDLAQAHGGAGARAAARALGALAQGGEHRDGVLHHQVAQLLAGEVDHHALPRDQAARRGD